VSGSGRSDGRSQSAEDTYDEPGELDVMTGTGGSLHTLITTTQASSSSGAFVTRDRERRSRSYEARWGAGSAGQLSDLFGCTRKR
jgi:hypothetical protein